MPDWMFDFSLLGMPFHFWTAIFFAQGAILGSFFNVCIHRMPRGESVFSPPSHCPQCGYRIPLWLNVPIFTWLMLRGRCANCSARISPRYLVIELITALTFAWTWMRFGRESHALPWALAVLFGIFIVSSAIDFEHFIIPDEFTLGGTVVGVLFSAFIPLLHGRESALEGVKMSLLGAGVGAGIVYAVLIFGKLVFGREHIPVAPGTKVIFHEEGISMPGRDMHFGDIFYRKTDTIVMVGRRIELPDRCYAEAEVRLSPSRLTIGEEAYNPEEVPHLEAECDRLTLPREAMGLGDVKFMACIGAFLGWQATVFSLAISSFLGAFVGLALIAIQRREWSSRLPYGPYIAAAAVIWRLGGYRWWERVFGP